MNYSRKPGAADHHRKQRHPGYPSPCIRTVAVLLCSSLWEPIFLPDRDTNVKSRQRSNPFCASSSVVTATGLTLKAACTICFQAAVTWMESCMNLIPSGGLTAAMIALVLRVQLTAASSEFRAAVVVFLCCRDLAQNIPFSAEIPEKWLWPFSCSLDITKLHINPTPSSLNTQKTLLTNTPHD